MSIQVPEELVREAVEAVWGDCSKQHMPSREAKIRLALQAILPKVRERLERAESEIGVVETSDSAGLLVGVDRTALREIVKGVFDAAFPPEGSEG